MRYHSLTIEDMPEDFVITSRTTDDQAIMGIQHRSLPIYGFNTIQKVSDARWAQDHRKFCQTSQGAENETSACKSKQKEWI